MQLTIDEIKELITVSRLDGRNRNAYGICPKCGEDEFGISLDKFHRFGCFRKKACGFNGNIFTLLAFLGKRVVDLKPGFSPVGLLEDKISIADKVELNLELPDEIMPIGWRQVKYNKYLEGRGFEDKDYEKFHAGITVLEPKYRGWTVFAIKQFGSIKGFIARNYKTKKEIEKINEFNKRNSIKYREMRYLNSSSDFGKMLLGIEDISEKTTTAILVEGLFDKHNVDKKLGLDYQDEVKCCCTFKCGVSDEQVYLLQESGINTIILMYDPDVIGEIKKAAWKLEDYFKVYVAFNEQGSDPGDMSLDQFETVLDNLQTPSQFSVSKLDVPELRRK